MSGLPLSSDTGHAFSGGSYEDRHPGVSEHLDAALDLIGGTLSEREGKDVPGTDADRAEGRKPGSETKDARVNIASSRSESVSFTARNLGGRPREQDWERMRELRAQGLSYYRIARMLHVNHTTVMYACDPVFRERRKNAGRRRAKVATHG